MIRILLSGAAGRMGKAISETSENYPDIKITHKVDVVQGFENIDEIAGDDVDVAVDLSSREGFKKALSWAENHKKPLVIGTTGLTEDDHTAIDKAAKEVAVLQASNLSKGVNIMFEILRTAAALTLCQTHTLTFQIEFTQRLRGIRMIKWASAWSAQFAK